jgi:hypothetical protein
VSRNGGVSYLDGGEWVLRTRASTTNAHGMVLVHEASIHATPATRAKWNAHFWSLFPAHPSEFFATVSRGELTVMIMFRFRPTVRVKQEYGGFPVLKVARTADGFQDRIEELPKQVAGAVDEYERDKRLLESQRRQAWLELLQLRLPTPPVGYQWELTSGDPRSYSDVLTFRLKPR